MLSDLNTAPFGFHVTLAGKAGDPDGSLKTVSIDWGDGGDPTVLTSNFAPFSAAHDYAVCGAKTVRVTATDTRNGATTAALNADVTCPPVNGLRAYYKLGNTAQDSGPSGLNGTITPDPLPAPDRFGNPQEALSFVNAGATGNVPTALTANLGGGASVDNQITLAARVRADDWNSRSGQKYILGLEQGPTLNVTNGHPQFSVPVKFPQNNFTGNVVAQSGDFMPAGRWVFVVGRSALVNGQEAAVLAGSPPPTPSCAGAWWSGRRCPRTPVAPSARPALAGRNDDVRIYNAP